MALHDNSPTDDVLSENLRATFSHEFEDGHPSGPARSYWDIYWNQPRASTRIQTICMNPIEGNSSIRHNIRDVLMAMEAAYQAGQVVKAKEIRKSLGVH